MFIWTRQGPSCCWFRATATYASDKWNTLLMTRALFAISSCCCWQRPAPWLTLPPSFCLPSGLEQAFHLHLLHIWRDKNSTEINGLCPSWKQRIWAWLKSAAGVSVRGLTVESCTSWRRSWQLLAVMWARVGLIPAVCSAGSVIRLTGMRSLFGGFVITYLLICDYSATQRARSEGRKLFSESHDLCSLLNADLNSLSWCMSHGKTL